MTECHAPGIKGQSCKGFILGKKKIKWKEETTTSLAKSGWKDSQCL